MQSYSELAQQLKPYILQWDLAGGAGGAGGASALSVHALDGAFHTGTLSSNQAPQFMLLNGTRPMTGSLNAGNYNITNVGLINGVDITTISTEAQGRILAGRGINLTSEYIADTPTISVSFTGAVDVLAGPGLRKSGLEELTIDTGYGLSINGTTEKLQLAGSVAGTALQYNEGVLSVHFGAGLSASINPGVLTVDPAQLAGTGLGVGSSNLKVNAGANLKLSGDTVAVDVPTLAGDGLGYTGTQLEVNAGDALEIVLGTLKVRASDLVGPGLNAVLNNLEVRTGAGLELSGQNVAVDMAYDFAWTGLHTHSANLSSAGAVSGTTGYTLFPNGNADFRDIQADTLIVDTFLADVNLALAGSEYITKSGATLSRDFESPATTGTLYVFDLLPDTQVFEAGDTVALRYINRNTGLEVGWVWGTVASYTDLADGEQSWAFTRMSGLSGKTIRAGMWAIDYGAPGDGVIKSTVTDLASPYLDLQTWTGNAYSSSNFETHLRLGNLSGVSDIHLVPSGYGLYSDNAYLRGELVLGNSEVILDGGGLSLGGFEQAENQPDTPEKITWYTNNKDRDHENQISVLSGYRGEIADVSGPIQANIGTLRTQAGTILSGISTGADIAYLSIRSNHFDNGASPFESSAAIDLTANDGDSELLAAARTVRLGGLYTPQAGGGATAAEIVTEAIAVRPSVDSFTDIGTPALRYRRLYVDEIVAGTTSTTDTGHNHDTRYYLRSEVDTGLAGKADVSHSHAGYATQIYVDTELGNKSDATHLHDDRYYTESEVDGLVGGLASATHLHDDRYFTEAEITSLLAGKSDSTHTHDFSTVTDHSDLANIGANDHHNQTHAFDSADHTGTLSWVKVNKTGALLSDLGGTVAWASVNLTGALLSDFSSSLAWTQLDKTGALLSDLGGSLLWSALSKTGSSIADLDTRFHSDLTNVGANDHHNQQHDIASSDHYGTLNSSQAPQFMLLDGTRSMTGHLRNNGSFGQDIGTEAAPWRNLHVLELMVTRLVSQDVMATIDGRILVSTSAKLTRGMSSTDTTMYADNGLFSNGEFAYLQTVSSGVPKYEAIQFASDPTVITVDEEYSYTIVRNLDEPTPGGIVSNFKRAGLDSITFADASPSTSLFTTDSDAWAAGDAVVSIGKSTGDGFIDISSSNAVLGGQGPTIGIYSRSDTSEWNDVNNTVAMGNLQGRLDYAEPTFGFAVGDNLNSQIEEFKGLTATGDGIRMLNTPISYYGTSTGERVLGAFMGSEGSGGFSGGATPILKIGPDAENLIGTSFEGFKGVGLWSGHGVDYYGDDGHVTYIGDSSSSYIGVGGGEIRLHGKVGVGAGEFTGRNFNLKSLGKLSFNSGSNYELLAGYEYDNNPTIATRFLKLTSNYTNDSYESGIRLESQIDGFLKQRLNVRSHAVTVDGNFEINRFDALSTRPGLYVGAVGEDIPVAKFGQYAQIWSHRNKTAIELQPIDAATAGGSSGESGPYVAVGHNSNATRPAPGHIRLNNSEGDTYYLYVDNGGTLRFHTELPTYNTDGDGAIVA